MRFIINLGKPSRVAFKAPRPAARPGTRRPPARRPRIEMAFKSVNTLLQNVYQVLKMEAKRHQGTLGSSVFGYNDIYCKLQPFLRRWKAAAAPANAPPSPETGTLGGAPSLQTPAIQPYIVSVDVSRAFDHVDIPTLLALVEPLLRCDHYLVLRYQEVVPALGSVRVLYRRVAVPGDAYLPPFPLLAANWAQTFRNKAFTDQVPTLSTSDWA
jgi:telomerase reverse transcriptase